jgi:hypothetical protein
MAPLRRRRGRSRDEEDHVDVRIGVTQSPKELEVLLADDTDQEAVRKHIETAVAAEGTLWLTDRRGRQIGIPVDKIAYIEIGSPEAGRHIGFGG